VASALKVEIGSPVLAIMRVVRDQTGRAVEYIRASYRPDLYEFNLTMSHVSAGTKTK
jgi:GntR family transcriptional regulator